MRPPHAKSFTLLHASRLRRFTLWSVPLRVFHLHIRCGLVRVCSLRAQFGPYRVCLFVIWINQTGFLVVVSGYFSPWVGVLDSDHGTVRQFFVAFRYGAFRLAIVRPRLHPFRIVPVGEEFRPFRILVVDLWHWKIGLELFVVGLFTHWVELFVA